MRVRVRADFRNRITDGRRHQGLTPLKDYFVLSVDADDIRVVDDKGDPILYPKALFEVIDPTIPTGWQFREFADGEYHLQPALTGRPGFYEEYFCSNGDRAAEARAKTVVREILVAAMTAGSDDDKRTIQPVLEMIA